MIICRRDRIEAALAHSGLSQSDLSKRTGVNSVQLNDIIFHRRPGREALPLIAQELQVSVGWLLTGEHSPEWITPNTVCSPPRTAGDDDVRQYVMSVMGEAIGRLRRDRKENPDRFRKALAGCDPLTRFQLGEPHDPPWWEWTRSTINDVLSGLGISPKEWEPWLAKGLAIIAKDPSRLTEQSGPTCSRLPSPCCLVVIHTYEIYERQALEPWNAGIASPLRRSWRLFVEAIKREAEQNNESLDMVAHLLAGPFAQDDVQPTTRST